MRKVFIVDSSAVLRSITKKICTLTSTLEVIGESSDIKGILKTSGRNADFVLVEATEQNIIEIEKMMLHKKRINSILILLSDKKVELLRSYNGVYIWSRPNLLSCSSEKLEEIAKILDERLNDIKVESILNRKEDKVKKGSALKDKKDSVTHGANYKAVLVGVSTGGPGAIMKLLDSIGSDFPLPILITQHIDSSFEKNLTDWLSHSVSIPVHIAENGMKALAGNVYFAPADFHMEITKNFKNEIIIKLTTEPPVNFLRPAVDKLFLSGAQVLQANVISVLLTGMGSDGAIGSCALRERGAYTIAEAEETCVVYGMPRAAFDKGGIVELLPLYKIADRLKALVGRESRY